MCGVSTKTGSCDGFINICLFPKLGTNCDIFLLEVNFHATKDFMIGASTSE